MQLLGWYYGHSMQSFEGEHLCSWKVGIATQCIPNQPELRACSYDSRVRIFDRRRPMLPLVEHDVGGGIWRVRWHPTLSSHLAVACMHDGFKVLNVNASEDTCTTEIRFDAHSKDALGYGVDWSSPINSREDFVCSCSFYDHQLRSWVAKCRSL